MTALRTYNKEYELVKDFVEVLSGAESTWGQVRLFEEFNYQRGRTDVVVVTAAGAIIAFEAKLFKWRAGVRQAYRNTCFAHYSYLVLPEENAGVAASAIGLFADYSVGLCIASQGKLEIVIPSPRHEPIQPWISAPLFDSELVT